MSRGVLHINTERGWRGGERQTFLLAVELARRGYRNTIAARPGEPLAAAALKEGIEVLPVRPWGEWDPVLALRLARYARAKTISILHAHTGHAVSLGALAKKMSGGSLKLVATRRVDFLLGAGSLSRWKYGTLDALVAISAGVHAALARSGVPEKKIRVIPSGIDSSGYPSTANRMALRSAKLLGVNDIIVVHAGALVPHKDQETLIRAFTRILPIIPGARLLILGEGPLRANLESLVLQERVKDHVSFLGHRLDVLEYIALADLFVFSSKEEGLGTALIDALAMGVPTASTAAGGIPDLYGGTNAPELSPVGDAAALAENMARVLNDLQEASARVERGIQRAKYFNVSAMADRYEALYKEVWGISS